MKAKSRQSGITLMEMTVVIAIVALLGSLGLPAVRMLFDSFESQGGGRSVISAAMASARAIAAREQRYAGIRFQQDLDGNQYMVFIVHDPAKEPHGTDLENGFRAVEGVQPIKLPDSIGVVDLKSAVRWRVRNDIEFKEYDIDRDDEIKTERDVRDTTSFSIIFSPSGKLVIREVRLRNRNGYPDTIANKGVSNDDAFNKLKLVEQNVAMFYQDDYCGAMDNIYGDLGLGPEMSRRRFVIYDRQKFKRAYEQGKAYSGYLEKLEAIFINPYTGTMIKR